MVFQHSIDRSGRDHLVAHVLATVSALEGHRPGRWLSAAALDRYLDFNGQEQFFGTQFKRDADGRWRAGSHDDARGEDLREAFDIPTDQVQRERAEGFN